MDTDIRNIDLKETQAVFPPTLEKGKRLDRLSDLPKNVFLEDYNEYYKLFKSKANGKKYIYKIKNPIIRFV